MKDRDKMAVGVRFELTEDSTPSSVFKTDGLNRAHPSHYEIEKAYGVPVSQGYEP